VTTQSHEPLKIDHLGLLMKRLVSSTKILNFSLTPANSFLIISFDGNLFNRQKSMPLIYFSHNSYLSGFPHPFVHSLHSPRLIAFSFNLSDNSLSVMVLFFTAKIQQRLTKIKHNQLKNNKSRTKTPG